MRRHLRSFLGVFFFATIFALLVRLVLIEDFHIVSSSMSPTLLEGDLVFVSKSSFSLRLPFSTFEVLNFRRPRRGEVVTFLLPDRGAETFVKRVVALEGDRVEFKGGVLSINGTAASYQPTPIKGQFWERGGGAPYVVQTDQAKLKDYGPVDVPKGHFFALGDNRNDSFDSRTWGPVPYSCLTGRVSVVWLSLGDGGALRRDRLGLKVQ